MKAEMRRCDISFIEVMEKISIERVKSGVDKQTESFRRLTKAVANLISTDDDIRKRIINAYLENDRKIRWRKK